MAGPAELVAKFSLIHQFTITTATNSAMAAATEALSTDLGRQDTLQMKAEYQSRRDFIYKTMTALGFQIPKPDGAFYIFAKIPTGYIQDDFEFSRDLAHKSKLAVIPGASFGPGGEGYIRLSYAASLANLQEAMTRLTQYMTDNKLD